jgi:protein gp37
VGDGADIEWTNATWNPVTGCDKVSAGCDNCYAAALAKRLKRMGNPRYKNGFRVTMHDDLVDLPRRWKTPRKIFVNSMSDLYHPEVTDEFIQRCFQVMNECTQHTFQILTKRPQRMVKIASTVEWTHNIWQGTSIENNDVAWRADWLRKVPAAVRFLSIEPMIGPVDKVNLDGIDWVIVGGESGWEHRPMQKAWVEDVLRRCRKAGIAFFFKQWGGRTHAEGGSLLNGRLMQFFPTARPVTA